MRVESFAERSSDTVPVIQTSIGGEFDGFRLSHGHRLLRKADTLGHGVHVHAQVRMRKRNVSEGECRVCLGFPPTLILASVMVKRNLRERTLASTSATRLA